MLVEQIRNNNEFGNFSYLLACPRRREALAVDPYTPAAAVAGAALRGWTIRTIINTHDHFDHTHGNAELAALTGARLLVSRSLADLIDGADQLVDPEDVISVGDEVLRVLFTPGHTMGHICLLTNGLQPALISGDTIFNAGVGNCRNGGDVDTLFDTITRLASTLPDECLIYPGHNYALKNLAFAVDVEPDNADARAALAAYENASEGTWQPSTIREEKRTNPFFRCTDPARFRDLRGQRDKW